MIKHPIPDEALDSDIAILGRKGGGKTYTSKGIVERLLDMGRRVLILDPLGVWAGLRTAADGEKPGYPIAIFGGEHADLPLDPAAAEPLARIIAKENLPAVIDLSELSKGAQQAFLLKFLHELRRVNREALTIVLEEADVFAPQSPQGDDSKQLHGEIDWISRRGRFRGFRLISICQRPARISKDVLTQANMLILHRLPAPQDREAAKAWVDGNGDRDQSKVVFETLSGLKVGEAWVLAQEPAMLDRTMFPVIKTLDTSSTPKAGEQRIAPKTLAQVDVSSIRSALEASKKAASNPVEKIGTRVSKEEIKAAEMRGFEKGRRTGHADGFVHGWDTAMRDVRSSLSAIKMDNSALVGAAGSPSGKAPAARPDTAGSHPPPATKPAAPKKPARSIDLASDPFLNVALSVWPAKLTWAGLASACGRKARGGSFNARRKHLIEQGLVVEEGNLVVPTNPPETPDGVSPADLLEQNLPTIAAEAFKVIRRQPGLSPEELADHLGVVPRGGSWNTRMSVLRKNGLITESGGLRIAAGLE